MALWSCPSCPESALLGLHPSPNHFLPPYCMNTHIIQLSNCGNIECIKRERTTYTRDSGSNRGDTIFPLKSLDSEPMDVSHFYSKPSHLLFFFFLLRCVIVSLSVLPRPLLGAMGKNENGWVSSHSHPGLSTQCNPLYKEAGCEDVICSVLFACMRAFIPPFRPF